MKILFVCRGNVGRSQIAEAIFNNIAKGKHSSISVGTQVIKDGVSREGQKIKDRDMQIIEVLKEIGLDASEYVRNQLTPKAVEGADKVVVMAEPETVPDYLKHSNKAIVWEVPDPKGQSLEFARDVRNKIKLLVSNFIATLN